MFETGIANLTSWLGNVILPTLSGRFLAVAIVRFVGPGQHQSWLYGGFLCLIASGILRALEGFSPLIAWNDPDLYWTSLKNLVNWVCNVREGYRVLHSHHRLRQIDNGVCLWHDMNIVKRIVAVPDFQLLVGHYGKDVGNIDAVLLIEQHWFGWSSVGPAFMARTDVDDHVLEFAVVSNQHILAADEPLVDDAIPAAAHSHRLQFLRFSLEPDAAEDAGSRTCGVVSRRGGRRSRRYIRRPTGSPPEALLLLHPSNANNASERSTDHDGLSVHEQSPRLIDWRALIGSSNL